MRSTPTSRRPVSSVAAPRPAPPTVSDRPLIIRPRTRAGVAATSGALRAAGSRRPSEPTPALCGGQRLLDKLGKPLVFLRQGAHLHLRRLITRIPGARPQHARPRPIERCPKRRELRLLFQRRSSRLAPSLYRENVLRVQWRVLIDCSRKSGNASCGVRYRSLIQPRSRPRPPSSHGGRSITRCRELAQRAEGDCALRGFSSRRYAPSPDEQGDEGNDQEDDEENFGDPGGAGRNPAEPEDRCNDGNDEENDGPMKHKASCACAVRGAVAMCGECYDPAVGRLPE